MASRKKREAHQLKHTMKELINLAANFAATLDEKRGFHPSMELIFIASEPIYRVDATGETIRERKIITERLICTPEAAEKLGKALIKLAEDAREEFAKCASIHAATPSTRVKP